MALKKSPSANRRIVFFQPPLQITHPRITLCAPAGAHSGVAVCFVCTHSFISSPVATLAPCNPNKVFASLLHLLKGATATESFARLLVAQANRAVTFFAKFISFSNHRLLPCSFITFRFAPLLHSITSHRKTAFICARVLLFIRLLHSASL